MSTHVPTYVALADHAEKTLAESLHAVADGYSHVADVVHTAHLVAGWSEQNRERLRPMVERYGEQEDVDEPERMHHDGLAEARTGEIGLVRDLQDLHVLADLVETTWTVVAQGAQGLRDQELLDIAHACSAYTRRQLTWLNTRMKQAAPQALIVAP